MKVRLTAAGRHEAVRGITYRSSHVRHVVPRIRIESHARAVVRNSARAVFLEKAYHRGAPRLTVWKEDTDALRSGSDRRRNRTDCAVWA